MHPHSILLSLPSPLLSQCSPKENLKNQTKPKQSKQRNRNKNKTNKKTSLLLHLLSLQHLFIDPVGIESGVAHSIHFVQSAFFCDIFNLQEQVQRYNLEKEEKEHEWK